MSAIEAVAAMLGGGGLRFGRPQRAQALTVVPVFHDGETARYRLFAGLPADSGVRIGEVPGGASVNDLVVVNPGDSPLLILEGEILVGLKQTRTLNVTVLVPAHSTVTIPVACVEAGRWGAPQPFGRAESHASPEVRERVRHGLGASGGPGGALHTDQAGVWAAVEGQLRAHRAESPTRRYTEVQRRRAPDIELLLEGLHPEEGQRGVLALIGDRPVAMDVFDRPETLAALWQGLVGSYAADALLADEAADEGSIARAIAGLRRLAGGKAGVVPAVGDGETVLLTAAGAAVSALVVGAVVVHLGALWHAAAGADRPQAAFIRPSRRRPWTGVAG